MVVGMTLRKNGFQCGLATASLIVAGCSAAASPPAQSPTSPTPAASSSTRGLAGPGPSFLEEGWRRYHAGPDPVALEDLLEDAEGYARRHAESAELSHFLTMVTLELGDQTASMRHARRCVELDATIPDCWLSIGVLAQDARKPEEAVAAYRAYLRLAPKGRYAPDASRQLERLERELNPPQPNPSGG